MRRTERNCLRYEKCTDAGNQVQRRARDCGRNCGLKARMAVGEVTAISPCLSRAGGAIRRTTVSRNRLEARAERPVSRNLKDGNKGSQKVCEPAHV